MNTLSLGIATQQTTSNAKRPLIETEQSLQNKDWSTLHLHEYNVLEQIYTKLYKAGTPSLSDKDYENFVRTFHAKRTAQISKILKSKNYVSVLPLNDLHYLKEFFNQCHQNHSPVVDNGTYDFVCHEISLRESHLSSIVEKLNNYDPYFGRTLSDEILVDLISYLEKNWKAGNAKISNYVFDVVSHEASVRDGQNQAILPYFKPPTRWHPQYVPYVEIPLLPDTEEWNQIGNFFCSRLGGKVNVLEIVRIQNEGLWRFYSIKKSQIFQTPDDELALFHGCSSMEVIQHIKKFGFSRSYCPNGLIGDGVYFACHSSYSNNFPYVHVHSDGSRQMFIAKVLVGKSDNGRCGLKAPPFGYHSVHSLPTMYCVFDHYQIYPEYTIRYKLL